MVDGRAYPLHWLVLTKAGASNLDEQQALIMPVLAWFHRQMTNPIVVLGDREFHSVQLAQWLSEQGVYYVLREKKDLQVKGQNGQYASLESRNIYPGIKQLIAPVVVVKSKGFGAGNLAIRWKRKYRGKGEREGWYLLSNLDEVDEIIDGYGKRMGIEEMFRDAKKGGYNLEECQAKPVRLNALILVISIAYTVSSLKGKAIKRLRQDKYVGRQRSFKKNVTKNSNFKLGLYGQLFCDLPQRLMMLGHKLMELTPGKRLFYWRGERAKRKIQEAF